MGMVPLRMIRRRLFQVVLISLGALDSNGCRCILEKGVLSVTLGAQVVMKGKKVGVTT